MVEIYQKDYKKMKNYKLLSILSKNHCLSYQPIRAIFLCIKFKKRKNNKKNLNYFLFIKKNLMKF